MEVIIEMLRGAKKEQHTTWVQMFSEIQLCLNVGVGGDFQLEEMINDV